MKVAVIVLRQMGQNDLAEKLLKGNSQETDDSSHPSQTRTRSTCSTGIRQGPHSPECEETEMSSVLVPSTQKFMADIQSGREQIYQYWPKNIRTRQALIITNIKFEDQDLDRHGAEKDEKNMESLLKGLGYQVHPNTNLSGKEMDAAVEAFSKRTQHSNADSTFVVIMSHGKRDKLFGVDYTRKRKDLLDIDNIFKHLNTANCPALKNKPKVIIIQACQGNDSGAVPVTCDAEGVPTPSTSPEDNVNTHVEDDFISFLSCTPGTKAYRDTAKGSIMIQNLVQVFNEHAHDTHIADLFTKVREAVKKHPMVEKQMPPTNRNSLTKKFYLTPGY